MLRRDYVELNMQPIIKEYNYATTTYSPLAGGMLTGKYLKDIPKESRNANPLFRKWFYDPYMNDKVREKTIKTL
jgi:aryl-alcohol dehydrogenase-like predicted oxidoreductase